LRRLDVAKDARDFAISPRIEGAELVFSRTSREALTKGIPGLYTFEGYHKSFAKEAERAAKRLATEEQWVMARGERSDIANFLNSQAASVYDAVRRLYLDDYRDQWTAYIKDLTIAPKRNLEEKIQLAQMLSDPTPNNPLKRLFTALARETTLADKPKEEKDLLDKAEDKTRSTLNDLTKLVPGMAGRQTAGAQTVPLEKTLVDDYFRNVRDFATAPAAGQPAPIDGAVALMNEIYAMLIVQKRAQAEKVLPPQRPRPHAIPSLYAQWSAHSRPARPARSARASSRCSTRTCARKSPTFA
jgi:type VI secretion system protein ImpL